MSAEPRPVACFVCVGGHRGMDRCGKCDGTGSQFVIPDGRRWPNTEAGWNAAVKAMEEPNDAE